jgi:hypothetical protein
MAYINSMQYSKGICELGVVGIFEAVLCQVLFDGAPRQQAQHRSPLCCDRKVGDCSLRYSPTEPSHSLQNGLNALLKSGFRRGSGYQWNPALKKLVDCSQISSTVFPVKIHNGMESNVRARSVKESKRMKSRLIIILWGW